MKKAQISVPGHNIVLNNDSEEILSDGGKIQGHFFRIVRL